ncbi:MAG: DUF2218 domain-containing protein [Pseudomonadota bacterium]
MSDEFIAQTGTFSTPYASRYLQQLCKHFAHKVEAEHTPEQGTAALPPGRADMTATPDILRITVRGRDPQALEQARHIIDSHLVRFAHREGFKTMTWS